MSWRLVSVVVAALGVGAAGPVFAADNDQPVATAPIPPPLPAPPPFHAAPPPPPPPAPKPIIANTPLTPMHSAKSTAASKPNDSKATTTKTASGPHEPDKKLAAQAPPHRPKRPTHQTVVQNEPPPQRAPIRHRYYADGGSAYMTPWYDRDLPPGAYYVAPWRGGMGPW